MRESSKKSPIQPTPAPNHADASNPAGGRLEGAGLPHDLTAPSQQSVAHPETLLPRLGDYLIEQNLITADELESALAFQKKNQDAGKPILVGQALIELDLIDPPDLDRAIVHQLTNLHFALQQSNRQLETRVQQRTHDLERRLQQIRAAAEITQMAVSAASLTELFQRCVDLVVERFGYYSAAIYLVDSTRRHLHLAEVAGPFSAVLRQRKLKILVGSRSIIGWVAANNRPRLVADISQDFLSGEREPAPNSSGDQAAYMPSEAPDGSPVTTINPGTLSQTRSQAAVPIAVQLENHASPTDKGRSAGRSAGRSGGETIDPSSDRFYFHLKAAEAMLPQGRVLGVLDVQSENPEAFDEDVVAVFQTIASHIASMVHNANLLESARISLTETMVLYRAGQEFTRSHNIKDVYRSLWNALSDLARDGGYPNLLMVPSPVLAQPQHTHATEDLSSLPISASERGASMRGASMRGGDTTPARYLRVYAPVSSDETMSAPPAGGSHAPRPSDSLTNALIDAILPIPSDSAPGLPEGRLADAGVASGSPFLILDSSQPASYPAPLLDLTLRLNCRSVALIPVRSLIGGHMRLTALIVTGLSPMTQRLDSLADYTSDYLIQTCVSLAELGSGAFIRVAAADVTEKRLVALQSLNTISQFISAKMDLNEVYKAIHAEVNRIIGDVNFLIAVYNPVTNYIQVPYMHESGLVDARAIAPFPLGEGLTSILINTRQPLLLVEDTEERARQLGAKTVGRASKSWLGVPLLLAGEVYGAIIVQDLENEHRFDEDDQRLLVTLASQVAIAIRTARLLENVTRQAERQELLNQITNRIRGSNDMHAILDIAANELRNVLVPAGVARVTAQVETKEQALQAPAPPVSDPSL